MKIAIDCADLDQTRIDGTRVYIKNLLYWFGRLEQNDQFFLYHQKEYNSQLTPPDYSNYIERKIPYKFWWTQTRFAYELGLDKPDVCWMPIHQVPYIAPKDMKFVVTIHDLAFKIFKDHFPKLDQFKLELFTDYAIKRADKIIAISEVTKQDILKFYPHIPKEKIEVVYHGFDKDGFGKKYSEEEIIKVLQQHHIVNDNKISRYLLYVGAIQPRKNLITLIEAFNQLKKDSNYSDLKLVLVGEVAWLSDETIDAAKNSAFSKDIILTGKVNFDDLVKIYQGAEVFVFPSLYEGFGIPILEAFASEIPALVADNSSLSEIVADAALKFESKDVNSLLNSLQRVLESDNLKRELIRKGKERLKDFSWEKCAKQTLDVIKSV